MIRIPLLEGEHPRADRNRQIGMLEVVARAGRRATFRRAARSRSASRSTRPASSRPARTCRCSTRSSNRSSRCATETAPTVDVLSAEFQAERRRLAGTGASARQRQPGRRARLFRIDSEQIEQDVAALLDAARADPDAATTCGRRLLDLRAAIDAVEDALEWPELVAEAEGVTTEAERIVAESGDAEDRRRCADFADAARAAVADHDGRLVRVQLTELRELAVGVLDRSGRLDLLVFEDLKRRRQELADRARGERLLEQGRVAALRRDSPTLRNINLQLRSLLPMPTPPPDPFSTVRRD